MLVYAVWKQMLKVLVIRLLELYSCYTVDDHGVIYYLNIYYLQLILLGSFAFSKIQVSVYIS